MFKALVNIKAQTIRMVARQAGQPVMYLSKVARTKDTYGVPSSATYVYGPFDCLVSSITGKEQLYNTGFLKVGDAVLTVGTDNPAEMGDTVKISETNYKVLQVITDAAASHKQLYCQRLV